jgi:hypothetical protein
LAPGGSFSRQQGLVIEADVRFVGGSLVDFSLYTLYDQVPGTCNGGPPNGYVAGWYGPGNSTDILQARVANVTVPLDSAPIQMEEGPLYHVKQEILTNGTLNTYINGVLTLTGSHSTHQSGQILLRGFGSVQVDNLVIQTVTGGPTTGTLQVNTNLSNATYSITGAASYNGTGSQTFSLAPAGSYTVSFNAVPGYITPSSQTQNLSAGGTTTFTGTYTAQSTGTIQVSTNRTDAAFTISGPQGYSGSGTAATFSPAPIGSYTISYQNISGFTSPSQQTQQLTAGQTITFQGTYEELSCNFTLSSSSGSVASGGGSTTVTVTASNPECNWTVAGLPAWLTSNPTVGLGTGVTTLAAQPYSGSAPRIASLTIAGLPYTLTQGASVTCTYALTPASASFSAPGGNGSFQVATSCPWTATPTSSWIHITSGTSGSGAGTVAFTVDAHGGAQARAGSIQINGVSFPITQNAAACTFTPSAEQVAVPAAGLRSSLTVGTSPGCAWSAVSNTPWITIDSGANGSVNGLVTFTAAPNSGAERSGTISIAGRTVTLTQAAGSGCPAALAPTTASFSAAGSSAATVQVNSPCNWNASSSSSWIQITAGSSGSGPGQVTYRVDANTGSTARGGTLTIANQVFPVSQAAPACSYSLSTEAVSVTSDGGTLAVQVLTRSGCGWNVATGVPAWITITSGLSGSGAGTVSIQIAANSSNSSRIATLTIAERIITITQAGAAAFSCTHLAPSTVSQIRSEGTTELTADVLLQCGGIASQAFHADVIVRLNTNLTSRLLDNNGNVDALLLIGDPTTPTLGTNAFPGKLLGNDAVRFAGVPVANAGANSTRTLRIVNLRADATVPGLADDISATVEVPTVGVSNARQIVARKVPSLAASFAAGTAANGGGGSVVPITFRELIPSAFRLRIAPNQEPSQAGVSYGSESGYGNSLLLGPKTGVADTATRLVARLRNIPAGTRVLAPVFPTGSTSAQLVAADATGAGLGFLTGSSQEVPVVNGEAVLSWEIVSTNSASVETLTFPITLQNLSITGANLVALASTASFGPFPAQGANLSALQPVPRFLAPGDSRRGYSLRVTGALPGSTQPPRRPIGARAPTGNRTFEIPITVTNDSDVSTPETQIRGNLSAGVSLNDVCNAGDSRGTCVAEGRAGVATIPKIDPGQTVTAVLAATLRDDAENGSVVRLDATASADFTVAVDSQQRCIEGASDSEFQPAVSGGIGTFVIYSCGPWTLSKNSPWVTLSQTSGTGNATITYTVEANTQQASRTATVFLPGGLTITIAQPGTAGGGGGGPQGGLRFIPVAPCRLLETRQQYAGTTWTGPYGPPAFNANQTRTLPIAGGARCNIPSSARAFVLNLTLDTVENGTGPVDSVTIYPSATARPAFWTARTTTGGYIANSAIVQAGSDGAVSIYTSNAVHMLVDITGYFTDDAAAPGLLYYPHGPCRAADTRDVYNTLPAPYGHQRMQARETRTFRLPGSPGCPGLPAASAYSLQMTLAPGAETNGNPVAYITAFPTGQAQPIISNMNAYYGYSVANSGIVPASSNGSISIFSYDATNVILDVNGYFAPDDGTGRGLYYFPVTQCRAVDTADNSLTGAYGPPQLTAAADRVIPIAGSPRCTLLPPTAKAFALNATAIPSGTPMPFLSMWPADAPWPGVSQLNAFQGQTVSNSGIVPAGPNGAIQVKVNAATHAAIEVSGYFTR